MSKKSKSNKLLFGNFYDYQSFHNKTKIKKMNKGISSKYWPKEWIEIDYKGYARFEEYELPKPILSRRISLKNTIESRQSSRSFSSKEITLENLSTFLYYSAGISPNNKDFDERRFYPSAGARYPLEIYIVSLNTQLPAAIFHYYVKNNSLEMLVPFKKKDFNLLTNQYWARESGFVIIVTALFNRTSVKYGERGYRHALVEAGHLCQNFYIMSAALNLNCCSLGGYVEDSIEAILDINTNKEAVVGFMAVGNKLR